MNAIADLVEHMQRHRLVLFVGADLPQALTGVPNRTELAQGLGQRKGLDETLSLAAVAQRVMQAGNRWEFTDYLSHQLEAVGRQPRRLHHLLIQLPVSTIITTAYDNLLELTFQQAGESIHRLVRDSDVPFSDPARRTLIKLYGDLQQRNTLVVTEDDHYGLHRDRDKESLMNEVRSVLQRNAILFLGYNLTDPDFNLLWREVVDRLGRFMMGAYAIWPGLSEVEQRMWAGRLVRVIDAEPLAFLEKLVAAGTGRPKRLPVIIQPTPKEEQPMTGLEPIATAALTKAVDFLFDQAGKILEERREARKKRGEDDNSPQVQPAAKFTTKEEVLSWTPKNVYLKDIPQEVKNCLDMIHQYRTNKRFTDATIAQYGGFNLAPINVRNESINQEEEIKAWAQKLKDLVENVYGHKITIVGLD